ncbi:PAS domain S-box protein [Deinococcus cellulosilyticus]|uniref:histidine kinase n=1 Tax=Deinococcus cellulosilyticus (strain DSM 18568 / NBRC 106333 / KACC 11606 / 5516J-15) TaxID=1223518 RepID=A0A511N365_DEIC1|nr:PAS domain S-box protein [Deinococcus cellulosilyticus]GEM47299.1 hypothetical protein DC3_29340 [Deinococcus cellulosilyticus NBRC 106333 = KACC 11606]
MSLSFRPSITELALKWPNHAEDRFAALFAQALHCSKAAVWLQSQDEPTGVLKPLGTYGIHPDERPLLENARINLKEPSLGQQAQQGEYIQLVWTRDLNKMGAAEHLLMRAYGLDTLFCCALRLPDDTLGLIYAASEEDLEPTTQQIVRAAQVAEGLTIGLHRSQLKDVAKQTRQELQNILQHSPDMIITRKGTMYTSVSDAVQQILGYRPDEMVGRSITEFIHPEDLEPTLKLVREHLEEQQSIRHYRCRFVHKDGHAVHMSWNTALQEGDRVVAVGRDISDIVEARARIQESENRFRTIANSAPVMLWMMDAKQQCTFFNDGWLSFRGRTLEQELGWGWAQGVHPDDFESCNVEFQKRWAAREPYEVEFRMLHVSGEHRWTVSRGVPHFSEHGTFLGYLGGCLDIHDRKLAQKVLEEQDLQLREVMRLQKQFMQDAAHELRTPLTAIQGNLEILSRHFHLPDTEKQEILSEALWETMRLGRLVNDMLVLARGDMGLSFRVEDVRLDRLLRGIWHEVCSVTPTHHFELGGLERTVIQGDHERLEQMFQVLLENAVRYTPEGGTLQLSLQQQGHLAELRLKDTGVGIGPEDLPRVFERFYRVDKARQRNDDPGGTGLGLPIAKWIVENHDGKIWLDSEPDRGTTVVVQFPLK